ncbi:MAG: nucleotidyltransferase domain-containing protein [Candidatus Riflebacteria bacterium]|nr:nucleotidyltransferase domain-containing protein [Candidatus Riflebacteria bacterium]
MSTLDHPFLSRARGEVRRLLYGVVERELHVRAIERESGLTVGAVREELKKLEALDLVTARRDGNRLYYQANTSHPLHEELRNIVLKTSGLRDVLREALKDSRIHLAFVFGSVAGDRARSRSDIDLMVIGSLELRVVSKLLIGVTDRVGREVNAVVMTPDELRNKKHSGDAFILEVLSKPKIFVIGGADELEALA